MAYLNVSIPYIIARGVSVCKHSSPLNQEFIIYKIFFLRKILALIDYVCFSKGEVKYSVTLSTSDDILHLLAFSSCLVHLLGRIFDTYNWLRYRQFLKRISRTIRYSLDFLNSPIEPPIFLLLKVFRHELVHTPSPRRLG